MDLILAPTKQSIHLFLSVRLFLQSLKKLVDIGEKYMYAKIACTKRVYVLVHVLFLHDGASGSDLACTFLND